MLVRQLSLKAERTRHNTVSSPRSIFGEQPLLTAAAMTASARQLSRVCAVSLGLLSCLPALDDLCYDLGLGSCGFTTSLVQFEVQSDKADAVNIDGILHILLPVQGAYQYPDRSSSPDGCSWYLASWNPSNDTTCLQVKVKVKCQNLGGAPWPPSCRKKLFELRTTTELAAATEALLYLAHKLQLPGLQQALHQFIKINSRKSSCKKLPARTKFLFVEQPGWSIGNRLSTILSDRVLDAAARDKQFLRQFMVDSFRGNL